MNDILSRSVLISLGLLLGACATDPSDGATVNGSTSGPAMTTSGTVNTEGPSTGDQESSSGEPSTGGASSNGTTETGTETTQGTPCELDRIELPGDSFYPEGVAAYGEMLFVGSIATGEVVRASTCDGSVESFVPPGVLPGAVGLRVDEARSLLWVCASDSTQQTFASLEAFDLDSGAPVARHSWDSPGMCNDIAIDDAGNVYATDSFGHRLLRVQHDDALAATPAETWVASPEFVVPPEQFGLNGIAWSPQGLLRVGSYADGRIFEIPVLADGTAGTVTVLGEAGTLSGPDGMVPYEQGLLVVEGFATRLSRLDLDDLTVTPVADGFDFPTTVAVLGTSAWIAEGQFDHLYGLDPAPPELPFQVRRIELR